MFSLPASMKKIRLRMKSLECSQHFPHYNLVGAIRCHAHQSSDPIWTKTLCSLSPTPKMVQIKFVTIGPLVAEIFKFENVYRQTYTQMTARLVYYKLKFEPSAQVS